MSTEELSDVPASARARVPHSGSLALPRPLVATDLLPPGLPSYSEANFKHQRGECYPGEEGL